MSLDELHAEVAEAIFDAETEPETPEKWKRVSTLEENIAMLAPRDSVAREVAAEGCVSAAVKAGDAQRAVDLAVRYPVLRSKACSDDEAQGQEGRPT